jgi:hypothetical protein
MYKLEENQFSIIKIKCCELLAHRFTFQNIYKVFNLLSMQFKIKDLFEILI